MSSSCTGSGVLHFISSMLGFFVICCCFPYHASSASHQLPVNVWPQPINFDWPQPKAASLSPEFTIIISPQSPKQEKEYHNRHLEAAVNRYLNLIRSEHHQPLVNSPADTIAVGSSPLKGLEIQVIDFTVPLQHGVDESYNLTIPAKTKDKVAILAAQTSWGAMRGLETFSQLVWGFNPILVAVGLNIWDSPLYSHRGIMLDTSRNFYGVDHILRTIQTMSANKLNVFHWHITDSHSFPLVLPSEPTLATNGSYGPFMQYSPRDVAQIVQFGLDHAVRVIPEIDIPAHSGSWAGAYPDIVTCAGKFWWPADSKWEDRLASEPGTGQLNPLHPKTYQVVENVLRDMMSLFPDNFYHSGGDEIIPGCWKNDPIIQSFLLSKSNNTQALSKLLEKFVNFTHPLIVSHNRTTIYWEDIILDDLIRVEDHSLLPPGHTILQTWNEGPVNTKKIVSAGYRVIVSSSEYYYLDCGHGSFVGNNSLYNQPPAGTKVDQGNGGSWCGPFKTWQLIYNYDITYGLTEQEKKLVLGGEVALWSEQSDPTVLDSKLWPRASAMAEALWSGNKDEKGNHRYGEATDRLNEWRHRMVGRGVGAEPIQPLWCARNPGMCNTLHPST